MSQVTLIVYGPQGCGKTANAEKIMREFGLIKIIDNWRAEADRLLALIAAQNEAAPAAS